MVPYMTPPNSSSVDPDPLFPHNMTNIDDECRVYNVVITEDRVEVLVGTSTSGVL